MWRARNTNFRKTREFEFAFYDAGDGRFLLRKGFQMQRRRRNASRRFGAGADVRVWGGGPEMSRPRELYFAVREFQPRARKFQLAWDAANS